MTPGRRSKFKLSVFQHTDTLAIFPCKVKLRWQRCRPAAMRCRAEPAVSLAATAPVEASSLAWVLVPHHSGSDCPASGFCAARAAPCSCRTGGDKPQSRPYPSVCSCLGSRKPRINGAGKRAVRQRPSCDSLSILAVRATTCMREKLLTWRWQAAQCPTAGPAASAATLTPNRRSRLC